MKVRDSALKEIELALRAPVGPTEGRRGRGNVSGALEKLLPAIDARRAAGVSHTEIIDFLIARGVVASPASYWTGIRIARRNFRERVARNTPVLAKDGGWNKDARPSGAVEPAQAPAIPVKPGLEHLSPEQIQELALRQLADRRRDAEIDALAKESGPPVIASLKGDGVSRHIGPRTAAPPAPVATGPMTTPTTKDLIAHARAEADAKMAKPKALPAGLQAIVDRQLKREQAEREEADKLEQKPEDKS